MQIISSLIICYRMSNIVLHYFECGNWHFTFCESMVTQYHKPDINAFFDKMIQLTKTVLTHS